MKIEKFREGKGRRRSWWDAKKILKERAAQPDWICDGSAQQERKSWAVTMVTSQQIHSPKNENKGPWQKITEAQLNEQKISFFFAKITRWASNGLFYTHCSEVYTYPDIRISGYPDIRDPDIFGAFTRVGSKRFRRLHVSRHPDASYAARHTRYV